MVDRFLKGTSLLFENLKLPHVDKLLGLVNFLSAVVLSVEKVGVQVFNNLMNLLQGSQVVEIV